MTIRYQCPECDSVLKIRDDKAGTEAKCPGCKKKFTVPEPNDDATQAPASEDPRPAKSDAKKAAKKSKPKPTPAAAKKPADDDFDAAAFLMEDGPGAKASAGLTEKPKVESGPATDSKGRRLLTPRSASSAAKRASMSPAAAAADQKIGASANAHDLLSKSMDESRVKASSMPDVKKEPVFDFSGAKQELIRYAPHIGGFFVLLFVCYWIASSMFGESIELPELRDVTGTVTVNGKGLSGVIVKFEPINAQKSENSSGPKKLRTSEGVTDENGYFELFYMQGIPGAPIGKGRIWLEPQSAADMKKIPAEYAGRGQKIFEVREAGNAGNFDLVIQQ